MNGKLEGKTGANRPCTECDFYCTVNMEPFKGLTHGNGIIRFPMSKDHSGCLVEKALCRKGTRKFAAS